ncbi:DUF4376 domain-containing protein [Stappia indica]|uniref:DUF4376 domain-containing protein n=1 Tax=Stappia indica TaxID=538381 RepID=UPI001CD5AE11|nr:DUF4376 domain-containing protein [Stappia indica]MCA1298045.1 DUF4376 domain-containing protein [Stappia indica]
MTTKYFADATTGKDLGGFAPAPAYEVRTPQPPIIDPETGAEIPQDDLVETVTPEVVPPPNSVGVPGPPEHGDMVWNGSAWEWPAPTVADLHAHLSHIRQMHEAVGVTVTVGSDAMEIETDLASQAKILGARVAADNDPGFATTWSAKNGYFSLDAAGIVAVSDAVLTHVNTSFAAKKSVADQIEAGTLTTPPEVEAAFTAALAG